MPMTGERIYHIIPRHEWDEALARGMHRPASLASEGFIHCSTAEQAPRVAEAFYSNSGELLLLHIDVDRVAPEIRYEGEEERFPHIYGELDLDAISFVQSYVADENGRFPAPVSWDTARQE